MIIRDTAGIKKAIELVNSQLEMSYDIESTGLNVRRDEVIGLSCASDTFSFYIIHKAWVPNSAYAEGGFLEERIPKNELLPLMNLLQKRRLITHNGSYDTRISYHYFGTALWESIYVDTMLAAHTLDEDRFDYKLKRIGAEEFGGDVTLEQERMEESIEENGGEEKQMYKADPELLAEYGLKDAQLTWNLYKRFKPQLVRQDLWDFFVNREVMPLYRHVTVPMELKGVCVDVQLMEKTRGEISFEIERIENEIQTEIAPLLDLFTDWYLNKEFPVKLTGPFIQKYAELENVELPRTKTGAYSFTASNIEKLSDCRFKRIFLKQARLSDSEILHVQSELLKESGTKYPFNIASKDHLKRLFFTKLKETPLSKTKKGSPQVDDKFLDLMADKYEWAAKLRIYNKLSKLKSTYIERILEKQEDGIFYPQFHQHRTTSGRYSGDLQQLPRKKDEDELPHPLVAKYVNIIRDFFISAPGWNFVDADYTSLEVVVFADDAQDEALLNVIRNDWDFYSLTAIEAEGIEGYSADKKADNFLKKHKPTARQNAKAYALGIRYGEQPYKISKVLNVPETRAKEIYNNYLTKFPKLASRMKELVSDAKSKGVIRSKAGRVRRYGRLKSLVEKYGDVLFDGLELWKKYHETPKTYADMKSIAGTAKNLVNNALNFPIQSMAASIVSQSSVAIMKEFKERGLQAYIAMSVHDELCIHCPEHETEIVCEIMQRRMENTIQLSVPLQAEPIVGKKYGDLK